MLIEAKHSSLPLVIESFAMTDQSGGRRDRDGGFGDRGRGRGRGRGDFGGGGGGMRRDDFRGGPGQLPLRGISLL